jgi:hypothetical protein
MATHLRVYPVSQDDDEFDGQQATVHVRLGDLLPVVALASRNNYLWLQDFLDDEVGVTADFYEVLRSFRDKRPGA